MTRDMVSSTPSYNAPSPPQRNRKRRRNRRRRRRTPTPSPLLQKMAAARVSRSETAARLQGRVGHRERPRRWSSHCGSLDSSAVIRFWGMDRRHRPFREIEPRSRPSHRGAVVLADGRSVSVLCTGSAQPKIFQRDGQHLLASSEATRTCGGHGGNDGPRDDRDGRPVAPAREDAVLDFWDGRVCESGTCVARPGCEIFCYAIIRYE